MILLTSIIGTAYTLTIGAFLRGIYKTKPFLVTESSTQNSYSVLIAVRNESENLTSLFESIKRLDYPTDKFEIVFINDHSEDNSEALLNSFQQENSALQIQILQNTGIGKKAAISTGIASARHDWILSTDADCILPRKWIQAYDTLLQKQNYSYISGPVSLEQENTFLNKFQNIEFLSLQGSTIGSFSIGKPFMSNGANSCYSKETFMHRKGFSGNDTIASGDDVFLLEKIISSEPKKVGFINSQDAIVISNSEKTWKALVNQKIRWAAKATSYKNKTGILVGSIVFLTNLFLIILLVLNWKAAILLYTIKLFIDIALIYKTASFFQHHINLFSILLSSLLYPFFSVYIFILSQLKGFEWKGRILTK